MRGKGDNQMQKKEEQLGRYRGSLKGFQTVISRHNTHVAVHTVCLCMYKLESLISSFYQVVQSHAHTCTYTHECTVCMLMYYVCVSTMTKQHICRASMSVGVCTTLKKLQLRAFKSLDNLYTRTCPSANSLKTNTQSHHSCISDKQLYSQNVTRTS